MSCRRFRILKQLSEGTEIEVRVASFGDDARIPRHTAFETMGALARQREAVGLADVRDLGLALCELLAPDSFPDAEPSPDALDLSDLDATVAHQIRETLALLLNAEVERRPTVTRTRELMDALAEVLGVPPVEPTLPPVPLLPLLPFDEPPTPFDLTSLERPALHPVAGAGEWEVAPTVVVGLELTVSTSDSFHELPTASWKPTLETTVALGVSAETSNAGDTLVRQPRVDDTAALPRPSRVPPPRAVIPGPPSKPQPIASTAPVWLAVPFVVSLGVLLGVLLLVLYIRHERAIDDASVLASSAELEPALPGGVIEVQPPAADRGVLVLDVRPRGAASVRISSILGYEASWAGTEQTLELRGLTAGIYTTKVSPLGGPSIRDTVEVVPGRACTYKLDVPTGAVTWTADGCR